MRQSLPSREGYLVKHIQQAPFSRSAAAIRISATTCMTCCNYHCVSYSQRTRCRCIDTIIRVAGDVALLDPGQQTVARVEIGVSSQSGDLIALELEDAMRCDTATSTVCNKSLSIPNCP